MEHGDSCNMHINDLAKVATKTVIQMAVKQSTLILLLYLMVFQWVQMV